MRRKSKIGQEEMVGFALIIVLVTVILVIFLGFGLNTEEKNVESYEVDSFVQSFLQYTSECQDEFEYLPVQELIFSCSNGERCSDEQETCEVLNSTLREIAEGSWKVQEGSKIKGYELKIISNSQEILLIKEGNLTGNAKGSSQDFFRVGNSIKVLFTVYN